MAKAKAAAKAGGPKKKPASAAANKAAAYALPLEAATAEEAVAALQFIQDVRRRARHAVPHALRPFARARASHITRI